MFKIALTLMAVWITADGPEREVITTDPQASIKPFSSAAACREALTSPQVWAAVAARTRDHAEESKPAGATALLRLSASTHCLKNQ